MASEHGGMSTQHEGMLPVESMDVSQRDDVHKLHGGAVGILGVLFLTVTGAAPISAMLFNTPLSVGYGNGIGTPAGFAFATVILTIFSVGYVAMARKVTRRGRVLQLHQPRARPRARDGVGPRDGRRLLRVRGIALWRLRVLRLAEGTAVRLQHRVVLAGALHGRPDRRPGVLRHPHLGAPARHRADQRGRLPADLRRPDLRAGRREHPGGGAQPGQRLQEHAGVRQRWRRDRRRGVGRGRVLRVLVVGRLRDGAELRRGVQEPQEDRPDGRCTSRSSGSGSSTSSRPGPRSRHTPTTEAAVEPGREQRFRVLPRPGQAVRERLPPERPELADHHRLVRLRDGLPQHDRAVSLLARS